MSEARAHRPATSQASQTGPGGASSSVATFSASRAASARRPAPKRASAASASASAAPAAPERPTRARASSHCAASTAARARARHSDVCVVPEVAARALPPSGERLCGSAGQRERADAVRRHRARVAEGGRTVEEPDRIVEVTAGDGGAAQPGEQRRGAVRSAALLPELGGPTAAGGIGRPAGDTCGHPRGGVQDLRGLCRQRLHLRRQQAGQHGVAHEGVPPAQRLAVAREQPDLHAGAQGDRAGLLGDTGDDGQQPPVVGVPDDGGRPQHRAVLGGQAGQPVGDQVHQTARAVRPTARRTATRRRPRGAAARRAAGPSAAPPRAAADPRPARRRRRAPRRGAGPPQSSRQRARGRPGRGAGRAPAGRHPFSAAPPARPPAPRRTGP